MRNLEGSVQQVDDSIAKQNQATIRDVSFVSLLPHVDDRG